MARALLEALHMMRSSLVLGAMLLAGCSLYFGGDDQPPNCGYGDDVAAEVLRDPSTGTCTTFGWGGGCSPDCPCPGVKNGVDIPPPPDWASCYTACDGLDEKTCGATPGCHADYLGTPCPPNADCLWSGVNFWQCSAVPSTGPIEGGDCWGLDAQTCSEHDDCASAYTPLDPSVAHTFDQCFPEPGAVDACTGVTCAPGSHCEDQCTPCDPKDPSTGCMSTCTATCVPDITCATVDCAPGYTCEEVCNGPICDPPGPCPDQCAPECVPVGTGPGDCYGTVTCTNAPPACPANTTPGVANGCYTGYCIPISACGKDPGSCYPDGGVMCSIAPPACPSGTEPGIANGCWTGYCIPDWACTAAPCASITDEKTCISRSDCEPIYDGMDCTCDPSGCTCATETFARCEDLIAPPPGK